MISMYDLVKKILKETNGQICKHCLGRKLSHIVEGRDNINRGEKIFEDLEFRSLKTVWFAEISLIKSMMTYLKRFMTKLTF